MKVIRTFVAILIDEDLKNNIARVQEEVKKLAPDVKWVAPVNLHVTLKFLGNVQEDALPSVFAAVEDAVRGHSPFELLLAEMGAFPNPDKARVVWVGISDGREQMIRLAADVDSQLGRLGFPKEERGFKAHITIGRAREGKFILRLAEAIGKVDARSLGRQRISGVAVMKSDLGPSGPRYTPLKIIEFS